MNIAFSRALQPAYRNHEKAPALKVALFSGNYNCVRDGANQALNKLVEHLLKRSKATVRVYSPVNEHPAFEPVGSLVPVTSIPIPGRSEYRLAGPLGPRLKRDFHSFSPDIVHVSAPDVLGRHAQKLGRRLGIPVVASMHTRFETYFSFYGLGFLRIWAERYLSRFYRDADLILAPNEPIAQEMKLMFGEEKVAVWSRGVDQSVFNPARRDSAWRRSLGYHDTDIVLMFFGRLVREKGLDEFARTVDALHNRGVPVRPLIIGDGPDRGRFAAALPTANFLGHLTGAELARAVASADIFLNPSVTEAFGNVNLEAMAAGVVVISADVASGRALLDHERNGLLVPPNDVDAMASSVAKLHANDQQRRGLATAALRRSTEFSWERSLARVARLYLELREGRSAGEKTSRQSGAV